MFAINCAPSGCLPGSVVSAIELVYVRSIATAAPTMQTEVEASGPPERGAAIQRTTPRSLMEPFRSTRLVKCLLCRTQPSSFRLRTLREDRHAPVEDPVHVV